MNETEFKNILHEALSKQQQSFTRELNNALAVQEDRIMKRVDQKFRDEIDPLASMINQIYTILDQDTGQRQAELQERAAINH